MGVFVQLLFISPRGSISERGRLRQVIASMHIDEINRDREEFLHNAQHSLEPELRKIGLVLINVKIIDITDESGYIEAIGKKAARNKTVSVRRRPRGSNGRGGVCV